MRNDTKQLRVFFIFTSANFFLSHFLSRAQHLISNGYSVSLVATLDCKASEFSKHGISFHEIKLSRKSLSPLQSLKTCFELFKILNKYKPDVIHNVAWKPIIYSSMVAKLVKTPFIVNAPTGRGFFFTDNSTLIKFLRLFVVALLKIFLNPLNSKVVVENRGHLSELIEMNLVESERKIVVLGCEDDILSPVNPTAKR